MVAIDEGIVKAVVVVCIVKVVESTGIIIVLHVYCSSIMTVVS